MHLVELTCRPSLVQTAHDACVYEAARLKWSSLKAGTHVCAAVAEVKKNGLKVEISPTLKGHVNNLDASADVAKVRSLEEHFNVGDVYEAWVVRSISSQKKLDLTFVGKVEDQAPEGTTVARLESVQDVKGTGVAAIFRLPCRRRGFVHITELYDFWAQLPLKRLKPNSYYEAYVLRGAVADHEHGTQAELSLRASLVHGQKEASAEKRPLSVKDLEVKQKVSGYIVNSGEKGVFVALSRSLVGRIRLKSLSDQIISKDKVAKLHPVGSLVKDAQVLEVDLEMERVELSLRKSDASRLSLEQLSVGDIVSGRVKATMNYGMFIRLDNSNLDALAHRTMISDTPSVSFESYQKGQRITRAKVTKLENGKIWVGLKASLFADDEMDDDEDDDDDGDEDEANDTKDEKTANKGDRDDDHDDDQDEEDDEPASSKAKKKGVKAPAKRPVPDSDDEAPWLPKPASKKVDLDAFEWAGFSTNVGADDDEDEDNEDEEDDEDAGGKRKPSKRQKKAAKLAEKKELQMRETENAEGTWQRNPRSVEDFERLLLTEGDKSIVWIRYMAFHLKTSDIEKARQVAERGVKHVGFSDAQERFNVWVAYLNLECTFGTENTADAVFKRAASHNNAKKVYLQLARIHERNKKTDLAVKAHEATCKKFPQSKKVWLAMLTFLYQQEDMEGARKTLPRALAALPKRKHPLVVSKTALLEYSSGSEERGRSIFEGLLDSYPKRTDLWSVYLDAHIKAHTPPKVAKPEQKEVRALFERCCSMNLKVLKMRFFFKRWLDYEKRWGDDDTQESVRERARGFVESQGSM